MQFDCEWPGTAGVPRRSDAAKTSQKRVYKANESVPLRPADDRHKLNHVKAGDMVLSEFQKATRGNKTLGTLAYPTVPLPLHANGMSCANSIILSPYDQTCLGYFPATTVYGIHSTGAWSPLNQVHRDAASSSSMVMHMLLAHAASDMTRHNSDSPAKMQQLQSGLYHYTAAIQELHSHIDPRRNVSGGSDLDAIISTLFLMIHYGLRSGSSLRHARTHFAGLKSLLKAWLESIRHEDADTHQLSPLSSQLIVWLL